MNTPHATIVIPTYNRAQLTVRAVESALAQRAADVEVIVVDDGSTDNTANRMGALGPRVHYLKQHNQRQGAARNLGIEAARSELVLFLDSDDVLLPNAAAAAVRAAEQADAQTALFFGGVRYVRAQRIRDRIEHSHGDVLTRLVLDNFLTASAVAVRTRVLRELGGFRTERDLAGSEDWELWLRITARYKAQPTREIAVERWVDNSGMLADPDNMARSMRRALDLAFADEAVARRVGHLRARADARVDLHLAAGLATAGRFGAALRHLSAAARGWPRLVATPLFAYTLSRSVSRRRTFRSG